MSKVYVGGQALVEGVMMRGASKVAWAARTPNGKIVVKSFPFKSVSRDFPMKLPLLRGVVALIEMMALGIKALLWSAEQQAGKDEKLSNTEIALTLLISIVLGLVIFVGLPYALTWLAIGHRPESLLFNLTDGVLRVLFFVAYIFLIGLAKDVRRLYQYHGAEHMSVHCHEAGLSLTPANVKKFSPVHPRCGTSLLAYVIGLSIIAFSLIRSDIWYLNVAIRIAMIPVIAGVSYELLRIAARWPRSGIVWLMSLPGLFAQRITTRRPDSKQIEVAIAALRKAL